MSRCPQSERLKPFGELLLYPALSEYSKRSAAECTFDTDRMDTACGIVVIDGKAVGLVGETDSLYRAIVRSA